MKKILIIFIFFVIAIYSLTACQHSSNSMNTVAPAKLTKSEAALLSAFGVNENNVFDVVVIDPNMKEMHVWVDYYEKGKKKEKKLDAVCGLNENDLQKKNKVKILFQTNEHRLNDDSKQSKQYSITCMNESSSSRIETSEEVPAKEGGSAYVSIDGEQAFTNKTVTLGAILENNNGSISAFDINEIDHNKLTQYDRAYFIRAKGKYEGD